MSVVAFLSINVTDNTRNARSLGRKDHWGMLAYDHFPANIITLFHTYAIILKAKRNSASIKIEISEKLKNKLGLNRV